MRGGVVTVRSRPSWLTQRDLRVLVIQNPHLPRIQGDKDQTGELLLMARKSESAGQDTFLKLLVPDQQT